MRSEKDVRFAMVPEKLYVEGSLSAIKTWCGLSSFANHANACWPSQREVAEILGVRQSVVCRGIQDLIAMRLVTRETDEKGRKFFQLHMKMAPGKIAVQQFGDAGQHRSDAVQQFGDAVQQFSDDENPAQTLAGIEQPPKWARAIDPLTRSNNQIQQPEAGAAGRSVGKATATAGLTRFEEYWGIMPKVIATDRASTTAEWQSLAPADQAAAIVGAGRYAAVFAAAPDDRKQYFARAARFLRERMWTMSDNEWRIRARVEIPASVVDDRPADFW